MPHTIVTDHPLAGGCPPVWASEWGDDEYGPWAAFEVSVVRQILRWIPAGQFLMGSDKPDSQDSERPRHWVTISRGFWLFDTPCTQELWETVTGQQPSEFDGSKRPVEKVSWNDARLFLSV